MTTVKLTARRGEDLRNPGTFLRKLKEAKRKELPKRAREALEDILGGLRKFCGGNYTLMTDLVSGEDETKATRAALKGKHGGEIKFALGYIYALADVYDCEPVELVS